MHPASEPSTFAELVFYLAFGIVLLIIGGLILVMLGVIGEYVWRINEEVRKRPNYIVRERFK